MTNKEGGPAATAHGSRPPFRSTLAGCGATVKSIRDRFVTGGRTAKNSRSREQRHVSTAKSFSDKE